MGSGGLAYSTEFEAREAARFIGRPYTHPGLAFTELPQTERANIIAQYRVRNGIDAAIAQKASKQK